MEKRTLFAEIYLDVKKAFANQKFNKRYKRIKSYLDKQIKDTDTIYPSELGRWDLESLFPVLHSGKIVNMSFSNIAFHLLYNPKDEIKIVSLLNEETESSKWKGEDFKAIVLSYLHKNRTTAE